MPSGRWRAGRVPGPVAAVACVAVGAVALWLAYGRGHLGFDAAWSLLWGDQLAHGTLPAYEAPFAPTPHPLVNLVALVLSPLGDAAPATLGALDLLALAGLAWAGLALGRAVASVPAGVVAAVLLVTRPPLVTGALNGSSDVAYLALVLGAIAAATPQPRDGRPALALLVLAGLIRPEAWLLLAVYGLYLMYGRPRRMQALIAVAALATPLLWLLTDLAVTGDPLHSLHGTRELAEQLARPRSGSIAPLLVPYYVQDILGDAVAWGGAITALVLAWTATPSARVALAALGLGLLGFLLLGVAGLPLLARYLLVPAAVLAVFCAVGLTWFLTLPSGAGPARLAWVAGAAVLAVLVAAGVPKTVRAISASRARDGDLRAVQAGLRDLGAGSGLRRRAAACAPVTVSSYRLVPHLTRALDAEPGTVLAGSASRAPEHGLLVLPASSRAGEALTGAGDVEGPLLDPPPGFRRAPGTPDWAVFERC